MTICLRRREFVAALGSAAGWPLAARAQQPTVPVIGYLGTRSAAADAEYVEAFRRGLGENGFIVRRNVQTDFPGGEPYRLPAMATGRVGRRASLIVAAGGLAGPSATAATTTISNGRHLSA